MKRCQVKVSQVGVALFAACILAGVGGTALLNARWPGIAGAVVGVYLLFAIRVADQWEKVAVLR
ncbi:MAG: slipin family protein, partial [Bryobacteraceae bacterium]